MGALELGKEVLSSRSKPGERIRASRNTEDRLGEL